MTLDTLIQSVLLVYELEQTQRTGYVKRGIPFNKGDCESVAEHTCTGAILLYMLALEYAPTIDAEHAQRIFLFHDIQEAITKDRIPGETKPPEKKEQEEQAYKKIISPFSRIAKEKLWLLYEEYTANTTPESQFAHDIDVFQRCIRAGIYFKEHPELTALKEFLPETSLIENSHLQKLCQQTLSYLTKLQ